MSNRISVDEQILVSAVRYALGRRTYIVADTVEAVLRVWVDLSAKARSIIVRDIESWVGNCDPEDAERWQRIVQVWNADA